MYLYGNCLQRYTKCVAFLELNGIKKKVVQSLSDSCWEFFLLPVLNGPFPEFARSAKSSRRSLETRDWREFSPFMQWEYKKCTSGKHGFFIFYLSDKKFINIKASGA